MTELTLLLVDDSDVDRYIVKRLLKKTDCDLEIIELGDGADALDWLEHYELQANECLHILLDLNMPKVSGFEFLTEFAALRERRSELQPCSITVLSSSNHPDDMHRSVAYPFVTKHMVKMPTVEALKKLLRQAARVSTDSIEVLV
ncbi:MAG: response regulator [Woeseia sp.]